MEEMLDIVDENDKKIGVGPKSVVHSSGCWHRSSNIWIVDGGSVLLQKRVDSGKFDASCGGHTACGELPIATAIRELKEELGLTVSESELKFFEKRKQINEEKEKKLVCKSIVSVFLLPMKIDMKAIKLDKTEISDVRLFDLDELEYLLNHNPLMFIDDIEYLMDMVFKLRKNLKKK